MSIIHSNKQLDKSTFTNYSSSSIASAFSSSISICMPRPPVSICSISRTIKAHFSRMTCKAYEMKRSFIHTYLGQQGFSRHTAGGFDGEDEIISTNVQTDLFAVFWETDAFTAHSTQSCNTDAIVRAVQVIAHHERAFSVDIFNVKHTHRTSGSHAFCVSSGDGRREGDIRSHTVCSSTNRRPLGMGFTDSLRGIAF